MSDATDIETPDTTPAETPPEATPAQPAYITMEQFTQAMSGLRDDFQQGLRELANGMRQPVAPAVRPAADDEPSDDEIDQTAIEGRGVGRAVKRAIAAARRKDREEVNQEIAGVRNVGLPALANLAFDQAKTKWPHYVRFQKQIDSALKEVPIELRTDINVLNRVYHMVTGEHQETLQKEAVEAATRQLRESGELAPAQRAVKADPKADASTYFAREDLENLSRNGKSIEHLAAKLGKTPEQYLATVERYRNRTNRAAAA